MKSRNRILAVLAVLLLGGVVFGALNTSIFWKVKRSNTKFIAKLGVSSTGSFEVDGTATFNGVTTITGTSVRASQEFSFGPGANPGSANGWLTTGGAVNLFNYTLPASESTTATLLIPVSGLHIGDTITGWSFRGQIESGGGQVFVSADLRKITAVAAGNSDASVGAITRISVTADTVIASTVTGLTEVVAPDEAFYVLVSGTTAGSTDIDVIGGTITVTQN